MESIVRVSSLTLKNIKNVKNGTISMPLANVKDANWRKAEVLGIYGQNGSGKTAIIDTFDLLRNIILGQRLDPKTIDYIDTDSSNAEIIIEFKIFQDNKLYEVGYCIALTKLENDVIVEKEYLNCAVNSISGRTSKNKFIEYDRNASLNVFTPLKKLEQVINKDKEIKMNLLVAKKMAEKNNCSYIFGEDSRNILCSRENTEFKEYSRIIGILFEFALKNLFVINNSHSGVISANISLPMAFRVGNDSKGMRGDLVVSMTDAFKINDEDKILLEEIIGQINTVLYTIIPNMRLEIKDYGRQSLDSGEDGWKVELMSVRGDKKPIPIRMESEGIIKIVSIMNVLIQAFGNPSICLVIDELDSGIFEYMLGELLDVFNKNGKGQLIFTSHNLRALEMLDSDNIMFSTVNAENRYIHMKNVKGSNNLRKMYIRSITLGGQQERVYEETDSLKIARAFRKAGRSLSNG